MKPGKYSAEAAFIQRSRGVAGRKAGETEEEAVARVKKEAGAPAPAISPSPADKGVPQEAHKAAGNPKRKRSA